MKLKEERDQLRHIFIEVVNCNGEQTTCRADGIVRVYGVSAGAVFQDGFLEAAFLDKNKKVLGLYCETRHRIDRYYIADMSFEDAKEKLTKLTGLQVCNLNNI